MTQAASDPYRPARLLLELRRQGVTDDAVLKAIETVNRADFAAPELADLAYEDCALPIGCGQTLYSPIVAGQLLQALGIRPGADMRVFVIGAGSGYTMALAAQMAGTVAGIDRYYSLVDGCSRVHERYDGGAVYRYYHGDGLGGLDTGEGFDRILLAGAIDEIPSALTRLLPRGGRMVAPVDHGDGVVLRILGGDGSLAEHTLSRTIGRLVAGPAKRL
ncbi:MAG: protein-L-isoaspartate(D-aspartate) O-methyltransferase [Pseudomonadota bacterium]